MNKLLIAVPTYNEKENLDDLVNQIYTNVKSLPVETTVLFIDDNSPDGTGKMEDDYAKKYSVAPFIIKVLHREKKLGLATAYTNAFTNSLKEDYDYFLSMDADLSHNPKYLPEFLEFIKTNDLVIASRNVKGGAVEDWSLLRKFISKFGSLYSRIILGVKINDFTGGYNMYTRKALETIDLKSIKSEGYSFQIEIKYKAAKKGLKIKEFPILFQNRKRGKAKMSFKIFIEAFLRVWLIKFSKMS